MTDLTPPVGIINSMKEWASEDKLQNVRIKEIYPQTSIPGKTKRRPPWPSSWFPNPLKSQSGYVAVIPDGRVWGVNGAIISPDNRLIWEASFEGVDVSQENHSIFREQSLTEPLYIRDAADLTHVFSGNYYHWMYEVIPRIHLIHQSGQTVDRFIVNTESEQPYQSETLHRLGLNQEKLLRTYKGFHVQAEHLIVPAQPAFPTKWGYDFLRDSFLKDSNSIGRKRIYISRKWSRKITNEDLLMEIIYKYGFEKVELESLSVEEQVHLFSSAEAIIGVHGAALTNLTFCRPGTKVLEIFAPNYIIAHFYGISSMGDLDYYYYIGEKSSRLSKGWPGAEDIVLNIPRFMSCLKRMHL
ncbi:glycosyltransferase family 61 protein [Sporolactobacillus vineae]|uniref:glycosyltransferase family 61 protein n=1 Tax=Sporolactobacillus vineae TaxID=444463 RepID=UPI0002888FF4|nr:glycosyltransferase family 61 protein [Sporolactobacillus vineae]